MSSSDKTLKLSIVFSIISQLIGYIIPLVVTPYISRVLLPEGIGCFSYATAINYYFTIIITFGFSAYGTKVIASQRDNKEQYSKIFWHIVLIRLIFFALSTLFYVLYVMYFNTDIDINIMLSLIIVLLGEAIDITFFYQGIEKFKLISMVNVFSNVVFMIGVFTMVKTTSDLLIYSILKSSIKVLTNVILWAMVYKKIQFSSISFDTFKKVFRDSTLFFLPTLVMTVGPSIDKTILGSFSTINEISYYEQAHKIIILISSLIIAIGPVMLSRNSYLFEKDMDEELNKMISKMLRMSIVLILPIFFGLYSINTYFIPLFFGEEFRPVIQVMLYYIPCIIFSPISSLIINAYFYPSGETQKCTFILVATILFNTVLNLIVVKFMGAKGAALASTLSCLLQLVLLVIFSKNRINYKNIVLQTWKVFVSSLVMLVVLLFGNYFISKLNVSSLIIVMLDIVAGALIYFVMCLLLKEQILMDILNGLKRKLKHE